MNESFVKLEHIYKVYPNGVEAVHDFNLDIAKHEFIVIVGPSGCGKSTTLRMVAGLEEISKGTLTIDGEIANELTPKDRNIAMVFQSYSLYPHMTVRDNISFGIRMRTYPTKVLDKSGNPVLIIDSKQIKELSKKVAYLTKVVSKKQLDVEKLSSFDKTAFLEEKIKSLNDSILADKEAIESLNNKIEFLRNNKVEKVVMKHLTTEQVNEKVNEVAKILELEKYLDRKPAELSGGQRQRVALGRSIIRNAKVYLMDEPLSNLDAKLRVTMRSEIIKLHERLNATIVYVTHDQTEAMTMADRIVVMKDGYVQQIGTPDEIYHNPANTFVANFMGSPAMNVVPAKLENDQINVSDKFTIKLSKEQKTSISDFYKAEIKELEKSLCLLNTQNEEIILADLLAVKKAIKSKDSVSFKKELFNKLRKPLLDFVENQIDAYMVFEKSCNSGDELGALKESLLALRKIDALNLLSLSNEFKVDYQDSKICNFAKLIKTKFDALVADLTLLLDFDGSLSIFEVINQNFDKLVKLAKKIEKTNKDEMIQMLEKLSDEINGNVIEKETINIFNKIYKKLEDILTLSDADIRQLYFTALNAKGMDEELDFYLGVVEEANNSKKHTNLLHNEYLLDGLHNRLISIFETLKDKTTEVLFGIRPEDIHVDNKWNEEKFGKNYATFEVAIAELLGKEYILHLAIGESNELICQIPFETNLKEHDDIKMIVDDKKGHVFDLVTNKKIF